MRWWAGALALAVGVGCGLPAMAEPVSLQGLTFSDELGGLRIVEGSGHGSLDDPFVLVEDITADGPAILVIRGMTHRFGNRIHSHHEVGFALTKVVRNRTEQPWSVFNLELREFLDYASPFGDGLSFGQASDAGRPFRSDRFAETLETREPFDGVQFHDGLVPPGEAVAVSVVISDTTPRWEFFLLQTQDSPIAGRAPPASRLAADDGARKLRPSGGLHSDKINHCRLDCRRVGAEPPLFDGPLVEDERPGGVLGHAASQMLSSYKSLVRIAAP
jgi:hypothetical protein